MSYFVLDRVQIRPRKGISPPEVRYWTSKIYDWPAVTYLQFSIQVCFLAMVDQPGSCWAPVSVAAYLSDCHSSKERRHCSESVLVNEEKDEVILRTNHPKNQRNKWLGLRRKTAGC